MMKVTGTKDIKKYLKTFKKRQEVFQKAVLKGVAEKAKELITSGAPSTAELGNYANQLSAAEVDSSQPMTAVVYTGPALVSSKKLDGLTTFIFVRGVRKKSDRNKEIYDALIMCHPFTLKTWPGNIQSKDFVLTYKRASEREVYVRALINRDQMPELAKMLKPLGVDVDPDQTKDPKKLKLMPDLTFEVLQHELRTKKKAKPHWIPALKAVQKKAFLKKLVKNDQTVRILADPNYNGFKLSGKMTLKVSQQSVQSTEDFMEYLQKSISPAKE